MRDIKSGWPSEPVKCTNDEKALSCKDAISDLKDELAELYKENFDTIATDYENKLALMEHKTNAYQTGIETLEAEGYLGATTYYEAMKKVQQSNIKTLESELADLTEAMSEGMANGNIAKYSEDWYIHAPLSGNR